MGENIQIDLAETGCNEAEWLRMAQDSRSQALLYRVMNYRVL